MARTDAGARGKPVRVAVIGYGLAGATFHAPLIAATPDMALASVVISHPKRQARVRREHPDVRLLPRVEGLWDLASEHDLAVVATPNRFHVPLGLQALEAGMAVVVDKPMAPTAQDGRRLIAAAEDGGLLLTVFQNRRWDGDFLTVQKLMSEGALGPVFRFESRFERWRPDLREGAWRERGAPGDAGGLLFDLGSHLIDRAVRLVGPPTRVYAEVDRRRDGAEVDDDVFVALTHQAGVRSHLWMSVLAAIRGPRMRVLGISGTYEKPPERWGRLASGDEVRTIETEPGAWTHFYPRVVESLRAGSPPQLPRRKP